MGSRLSTRRRRRRRRRRREWVRRVWETYRAGDDDDDDDDDDEEEDYDSEELYRRFARKDAWRCEAEEGREKCYDPLDPTLTFVDGDDDLDFLCNDYKSLRAKMSCGHAVTPTSLSDWCRWLLDEGECRFVCGQPDCDAEWPFEEVCKMALLTPEETEDFEKKLFNNAATDYLGVKACPGCKSQVMRGDLSDLSVKCTVCTADKKRAYVFCWQCLREWRGPAPRADRCGNEECQDPVEILRRCPDVTFEDVEGVRGCPSIRACPTCGMLLEHNKTKCKNIVCRRCKVEFCFVCLKLTEECLGLAENEDEVDPFSFYEPCSTGVAPRQTSIPVWQKM